MLPYICKISRVQQIQKPMVLTILIILLHLNLPHKCRGRIEVPLVVTSEPLNFITENVQTVIVEKFIICKPEDRDSYENKNESPSAIPESLMHDQLKPAPPILVISEAVVSLARHNT